MTKPIGAWFVVAVCAAGLGATAPPAQAAAALGVEFAPRAPDFGASSWNLGWSFTVKAPVTVIALGNWAGGAPFAQDQQVGLWDTVGQTYVVGGQGGADYTGTIPATFNTRIAYVADLFTLNGGANAPLVEPTSTESQPYGWFGGNVEFSTGPVPEPASWAMMLLGLGALGMAMRGSRGKVSA